MSLRQRLLFLGELVKTEGSMLDGHTVGELGERFAAEMFDLRLAAASQEGFDAWDSEGKTVQIKATAPQSRLSIALQADVPIPDRVVDLAFGH